MRVKEHTRMGVKSRYGNRRSASRVAQREQELFGAVRWLDLGITASPGVYICPSLSPSRRRNLRISQNYAGCRI